MKSPVVKRSIVIGGHKTSVSLEDAFWTELKEIAHSQRATVSKLIAQIASRATSLRLSAYMCWNTSVAMGKKTAKASPYPARARRILLADSLRSASLASRSRSACAGLENSPLLILLMIVCSSAFASSVSSSRRATSRLTELGYA
jgi:predicted DNA-binding ribbon-helix-helix protein